MASERRSHHTAGRQHWGSIMTNAVCRGSSRRSSAAIYGAVRKSLAGAGRGGLIASIVLGFVGALFGPWVARQLNLSEPLVLHVSGHSFPIV
jgi:outer membrane lipoprotein SlyB